ncbi:restriction endonuclease subunit S [Mycoplasmopsis arginini]|uniref:restriction endonuclease subunit S n=1 Tax=Mycoplasmopsis arginini TaxID=2094 RepID=UPI003D03A8DF
MIIQRELSSSYITLLNELERKLLINNLFIYEELQKVCEMKYGVGNVIPKNINGIYPVYGANGVVSIANEYNNSDSVIVGHIGTVGKVIWAPGKHYVTYNGTIVKSKNNNKLVNKFIYYFLLTQNLEKFKKGSQPFLSIKDFNKILIPIPTIEVQNKIVEILDRLETYIQDIKNGLPKEIEERKKQYKYYLNKLLNFD